MYKDFANRNSSCFVVLFLIVLLLYQCFVAFISSIPLVFFEVFLKRQHFCQSQRVWNVFIFDLPIVYLLTRLRRVNGDMIVCWESMLTMWIISIVDKSYTVFFHYFFVSFLIQCKCKTAVFKKNFNFWVGYSLENY